MASVIRLAYQVNFQNTNSVYVRHNLDEEQLIVRVISDGEVVEDFSWTVDKNDPTNALTVSFPTTMSGTIQICISDYVIPNIPTAQEGVTLLRYDNAVFESTDKEFRTTSNRFIDTLSIDLKPGTYYVWWSCELTNTVRWGYVEVRMYDRTDHNVIAGDMRIIPLDNQPNLSGGCFDYKGPATLVVQFRRPIGSGTAVLRGPKILTLKIGE